MAKKKYLDKDGAQRIVDKTLGLVTPENLLTGLKTVDGAGSGLDADTLDGVQGERYIRTVSRSSEEIDLNYYTENVFRELRPSEQSTLNCPISIGAYGGILNLVSGDNIAALQIAFNSGNDFFIRARHGYNKPFSSAWRNLAFLDSNVASADKLTTKLLTNEDLNTIKDENFTVYFGNNNNTCANKPAGVNLFSLQSFKFAYGGYVHILTDVNGDVYIRRLATTWCPWKKLLTNDDIASLVSRIEALENGNAASQSDEVISQSYEVVSQSDEAISAEEELERQTEELLGGLGDELNRNDHEYPET